MIPRTYSPDWLDDEGAAYAVSLPVSSFREYVERGLLPKPVKIGRHSRWSRESLNASLAELSGMGKAKSVADIVRELADGQEAKGGRHAA
jgi:predicted DNA-binding transcriptional regulator AlpA